VVQTNTRTIVRNFSTGMADRQMALHWFCLSPVIFKPLERAWYSYSRRLYHMLKVTALFLYISVSLLKRYSTRNVHFWKKKVKFMQLLWFRPVFAVQTGFWLVTRCTALYVCSCEGGLKQHGYGTRNMLITYRLILATILLWRVKIWSWMLEGDLNVKDNYECDEELSRWTMNLSN